MTEFDPLGLVNRACKDCDSGNPNDIKLDDNAGDMCDYCLRFICND